LPRIDFTDDEKNREAICKNKKRETGEKREKQTRAGISLAENHLNNPP